ncbi:MAG: hypothetical protein Q7J78_06350 [Clostridiales bacterium]|nr:hypothetical protein [Clostridiales bacterium]
MVIIRLNEKKIKGKYLMIFKKGNAEEAGMSAEKLKLAEDFVASWVYSGDTSASVILVARKGVIVSHKNFGKASYENNAPELTNDINFPWS